VNALESAREFVSQHTKQRGPQCRICQLPEEDRRIAETLLSEGATGRVVADWLREVRGHNVGYPSVAHHRRDHERLA